MNIKEYLSDKSYGFYVILATMFLSLVTILVYSIGFSQIGFLSWEAIVSLIVGVVVGAGLLVLKQYKYVPGVLFATIFFAFIMVLYYVYDYIISAAFWGSFAVPGEIIAAAVFFLLAIAASIVSIFAPIVNKENA
ncbi:MAG: hypothetical protein J6Y68_03860 [Clostridia bacterium]|nr:hypothetical protein [Clostridia bacterium]